MEKIISTNVLIIGAGPSGICLGHSLLANNFKDFLIIDMGKSL